MRDTDGWLVVSCHGQSPFPCFEKLVAPFVMEAGINPFTAAQHRDAAMAIPPLSYNPDFSCRWILPAGLSPNLPYDRFTTFFV